MIIIFGTRSKKFSGKSIQSLTCPNCGDNSHNTFGIIRYFHIFWIPVLPFRKLAGVECQHCGKARVGKEVPAPVIDGVRNTVFSWNNTLPWYTGLVLIAGLLATGIVADEMDNRREQSYLAAPHAHDYYLVDFTKIFTRSDPEFRYGVMRIKSVSGEQVEMQVSNYAYSNRSGPRKAIRRQQASHSDYYVEQAVYFDLSEIQQLKASGAIYSVERG